MHRIYWRECKIWSISRRPATPQVVFPSLIELTVWGVEHKHFNKMHGIFSRIGAIWREVIPFLIYVISLVEYVVQGIIDGNMVPRMRRQRQRSYVAQRCMELHMFETGICSAGLTITDGSFRAICMVYDKLEIFVPYGTRRLPSPQKHLCKGWTEPYK